MSRTTTILAMTLSTLLLAATTTLAGPKRPPATATPPLATYLTPAEQLCQQYGNAALTLARSRDSGISRFTALAIARRIQASSGIPPIYYTMYETILTLVYDFPTLSPTWIQQHLERECLKSDPPQPDAARLRY